MARRCMITGKGVMSGNNVSHAKNRTRRRFLPNLQETSVWSDALSRPVRLKVAVNGLRTIEHNGGIDSYLPSVPDSELCREARQLKRQIKSALAAKAA